MNNELYYGMLETMKQTVTTTFNSILTFPEIHILDNIYDGPIYTFFCFHNIRHEYMLKFILTFCLKKKFTLPKVTFFT